MNSAPSSVTAWRNAVFVVFTVNGLGMAAWISRIPALRDQLDIPVSQVGILLFATMLLRVLWRLFNPAPAALENHGALTRLASKLGHAALYLGLFGVMVSGYLISTADGRGIEVFGLFSVPATLTGIEHQEDIAGDIHEYLAWGLVIFAVVHGLAALKHHFIDRDSTLLRMFGR